MPKLALALLSILLGALPSAAATPEEAALTRLGEQVATGFASRDRAALERLIDLRAVGLRASRDAYDTLGYVKLGQFAAASLGFRTRMLGKRT